MLNLVCDNTKSEEFSMAGCFTDPGHVVTFMTAGHAVLTLRSMKTGKRFTFKLTTPKKNEHGQRFVALLTGPDNEGDYTYLGMLESGQFRLTRASKLPLSSEPVQAFGYLLRCVYVERRLPTVLQVWHEGKCGRCGRTLTVPESIERGIGPECASKLGG
jgi:hypothetical protein